MKSASFSEKKNAIEQLHQQDAAATVSSEVEKLLSLWTDDGVALPPGGPPVTGKQAILAWIEKNAGGSKKAAKTLKYAPQVRELKIYGNRAYEWGDFLNVHESPNGELFEIRGKFVRALKRQVDGSWKFSRVMWNIDQSH